MQIVFLYPEPRLPYLVKLVNECTEWLEWYPGTVIVPLTSWLPDPHTVLMTSLQCSSVINKMCISRNGQYVFCSTLENNVIQMFHVASKKFMKNFTGKGIIYYLLFFIIYSKILVLAVPFLLNV